MQINFPRRIEGSRERRNGRRYRNNKAHVQLVDHYNELLSKMCPEKHVRLIPLASQLTGGITVFKDICHVTPEGAELKSEIIATDLKDYVAQQLNKLPQ